MAEFRDKNFWIMLGFVVHLTEFSFHAEGDGKLSEGFEQKSDLMYLIQSLGCSVENILKMSKLESGRTKGSW